MEFPTTPESFTNVLLIAVFTGALTAWLKVLIKRKVETNEGDTQQEGKADSLILALVLVIGIATAVVAQCVLSWPPTAYNLFVAVMAGFFASTLSSFGAKLFISVNAWIMPNQDEG